MNKVSNKTRLNSFSIKKLLIFSLVVLSLLSIYFVLATKTPENNSNTESKITLKNISISQDESDSEVLGLANRGNYYAPRIFIYGPDQKYSSGGMISQAVTDNPEVYISTYNTDSQELDAEIQIYKANIEQLLDYLVHDDKGNQVKSKPNINELEYIGLANQKVDNRSESKVLLPIDGTGIWYLKVRINSGEADAFLLRSKTGVLAKEGDNEFIFWGQDFLNKRSIDSGNLKILNLLNSVNTIDEVNFDDEGIAKSRISISADIALLDIDGDYSIIPINLKYLNNGGYEYYKNFTPKRNLTKYFIFTDRPLYKPGDTVYFKAILRNDDDARYTIPRGQANVKVAKGYYYNDQDPLIFDKNFNISQDGTINGEFTLPDSQVGMHNISIQLPGQDDRVSYLWDREWSTNSISFDVQYYRKPELSIEIETPQREYIAGDIASFTVKGNYFSGQPMINQEIKYKIYSSNFYQYEYLSDAQNQFYENEISDKYRYSDYYGSDVVAEGTANLDSNGTTTISIDTSSKNIKFKDGNNQVFSIEATVEDGSIDPSFDRKNILVYAGEYSFFRNGYSNNFIVNKEINLPIKVVAQKISANKDVNNLEVDVQVTREYWIKNDDPKSKYDTYIKQTENLPSQKLRSDQNGDLVIKYLPKETGSYIFKLKGNDQRRNAISKDFYVYVTDKERPFYNGNDSDELTISLDKAKYKPTETASLNIYSSIPNRDVFLSLDRGRVNRYQVVKINGNSANIQIPLQDTDVPNVIAKASSFSDYMLNDYSVNIPVSTDGKKLVIKVTPDTKEYGPGETSTININTTDFAGNPLQSEVALWVVDKAIFELSTSKLGNIFDTFWYERYNSTEQANSLEGILVNMAEGGGCFAKGTKVLMSDGLTKNIEDVKIGDYILTRTENSSDYVKAKVTNTHKASEPGYMILNGELKLTPNHKLWVNSAWTEAGNIQIGDYLTDKDGEKVMINSVEFQAGKFDVYNLTIQDYQTYFADGYWVHNEKGNIRSTFKDTAYWNPSIKTDVNGMAKVSFVLPDNLTTWTIAAVGVTSDTKVGQTTEEIVVNKDLVIRPVLPNFLRIGDEIYLSAIVQNFTQQDQNIDVELKYDSGQVLGQTKSNISLKSQSIDQIYWKVKPESENESSKIVFSMTSNNDPNLNDIVELQIPSRSYGFTDYRSQYGEGNQNFDVNLAKQIDKDKTTAYLSLSPTVMGSLVEGMKYLVEYPYGCTEQTTSRFVPTLIAKENSSIFGEALKDKDINEIVNQSIKKLGELQQWDGGWSWWTSGKSEPFVTAYVVEYLVYAKNLGYVFDNEILNKAEGYLSINDKYDSASGVVVPIGTKDQVAKNYGLTIIGSKEKIKKIYDIDSLTPDYLSLYVMTNYLNGDNNSQTNGLNKLNSLAKQQGEGVYWEAGEKDNYGSVDASTSMALRANNLVGGDTQLQKKAVIYLTRNRKSSYWSNTYATSQVVRALVDYSKQVSELNPNYEYTVLLDNKEISRGQISSTNTTIPKIDINVQEVKDKGSVLQVTKSGEGSLYSTLVINEYNTDTKAESVNSGLNVKREYVNAKGSEYNLAVGDIVDVKITVEGLKESEYYGVIKDELPSGLVPINTKLNNEQYYNQDFNYNNYFDITDTEFTEDGVVLSIYRMNPGIKTYTYKARVVNYGQFNTPPVQVSLMYAPEIYGRSESQTVNISDSSKVRISQIPEKILKKDSTKYLLAGLFVTALITTLVIIKKKKSKGYKFDIRIRRNSNQEQSVKKNPTKPQNKMTNKNKSKDTNNTDSI